MYSNGFFLCIDPCAKHIGRAKEYPYLALVGVADELFAHFIVFSLLDKTDFVSRNAVVFYQFAFDFSVGIPFVGLVSTQIRKDKLSTFLRFVLLIIFIDFHRTMRGFVIGMIFILIGDHSHI